MQMVAGKEHRQPDRSRNSSWMEISLQRKEGETVRGGQNTSGKGNSSEEILWYLYDYHTSTECEPHQKRCALCFYFNPRRNLRPLSSFTEKLFLLESLSFLGSFLNATTPTP